ncbi:MAG: hypothetical protein V1753_03825 [Pseudomonadota bacterium]
MKLTSFQNIVTSLNTARVKYIVVGGMAVVAYGYGRMTYDLDLVIALDRENILKTFSALSNMGYKPRVPVTPEQFSNRDIREGWIRDKGMQVLNLYSDEHRTTPIDIFVYEPFDFEKAYKDALQEEILPGQTVRFIDIYTLIRLKEKSGRAKDIDDVLHLKELIYDEPE